MNYLLEIENEFSKIKGRPTRLSPMDWQLGDTWEKQGIPLHIVFRAMNDVQKKFTETKRPDSINSLKYFKQAVEKQFAEWQTSQIGKAVEENNMEILSFAEITDGVDETVDLLENLVSGYSFTTNLPEPLRSAAQLTRGELLALIDETKQKQLSFDDIEDRLFKLAETQNLSLAVSISPEEIKQMVDAINREYKNRTLDDDSRRKILIKQLYKKFRLPELRLIEL